jgi:hypothetical protein
MHAATISITIRYCFSSWSLFYLKESCCSLFSFPLPFGCVDDWMVTAPYDFFLKKNLLLFASFCLLDDYLLAFYGR